MCCRTLAASSSYLNARPQSVGNEYSFDCSGTATSAWAGRNGAATIPTPRIFAKSRREDTDNDDCGACVPNPDTSAVKVAIRRT